MPEKSSPTAGHDAANGVGLGGAEPSARLIPAARRWFTEHLRGWGQDVDPMDSTRDADRDIWRSTP